MGMVWLFWLFFSEELIFVKIHRMNCYNSPPKKQGPHHRSYVPIWWYSMRREKILEYSQGHSRYDCGHEYGFVVCF